MERVGAMGNMKDGEDYGNPLCCLVRGRELKGC